MAEEPIKIRYIIGKPMNPHHANKPGDTLRKTMQGFGLTDAMMPPPAPEPTYPTSEPAAEMVPQWPWPGNKAFPKGAKVRGAKGVKGVKGVKSVKGQVRTMRKVRKAYGHQ